MDNLNQKTLRIKEALDQSGIETIIKEFPSSTRTAQEAADAIGCTISQIAKSIIFKSKESGKPILIITSGSNRVDEKKVEKLINESLEKADADFVLNQTGYIIGGVPPFAHSTKITPLIDEDLLQYEEIWASAGTPNSVFKITPQDLITITKGRVANVKS